MSVLARATALCTVIGALLPGAARAEAVFEVVFTDADGFGFYDAMPVAAVGGNAGSTLGEQRRIALQYAADLWGQVLDSPVPIVIEADFEALGCTDPDGATLAHAGTMALETGLERGGANPNFVYVAALADRLMGEDQHPGDADIGATFNLEVDDGCLGDGARWYYGLDAKQGGDIDFVNVALHELGHGLGVHDLTVHESGAFIGGLANPYAAHVLDVETGKHWHEMTDAERLASVTRTRRLVWDGPRVAAAAPERLMQGSPRVRVTPDIGQFSGLAGDATFGGQPLAMSLSASLVSQDDGCPLEDVTGRIALLRGECAHSGWVAAVEEGGAVGAVLSLPFGWSAPPPSIEEERPEAVQIPVLTVTDADAERLHEALRAGDVMVHFSYDAGSLRGTDARGRLLLNATVPPSTGSVSHWDMLARPNLLMEPFENAHDRHDVDLTPALLADIGWSSPCSDGRVDAVEPCDPDPPTGGAPATAGAAGEVAGRDATVAGAGGGEAGAGSGGTGGATNGGGTGGAPAAGGKGGGGAGGASDGGATMKGGGRGGMPDAGGMSGAGAQSAGDPGADAGAEMAAGRDGSGCGCRSVGVPRPPARSAPALALLWVALLAALRATASRPAAGRPRRGAP